MESLFTSEEVNQAVEADTTGQTVRITETLVDHDVVLTMDETKERMGRLRAIARAMSTTSLSEREEEAKKDPELKLMLETHPTLCDMMLDPDMSDEEARMLEFMMQQRRRHEIGHASSDEVNSRVSNYLWNKFKPEGM